MILLTDRPKPPTEKEKIESLLCGLLGSSYPNGKRYLTSAVLINMTEYKNKQVPIRVLLERIGDEHGIAAKSIATAISRYINNNWYSGNAELQDAVFGNMLSFRKPTPTVSKFISAVTIELSHTENCSR